MYKKLFFISSFIFFITVNLFGQVSLLSQEEQYLDTLALNGDIEKPTINYRTLSDSYYFENLNENSEESHIWKDNQLITKYTFLDEKINLYVFNPYWYSSYNSSEPYGQNDGGLWQGRGYNTAVTTGAQIKAYGFEAIFKPQFSFSQNKEYEYPRPNYSGSNYSGKAEDYGYYGLTSIDAPQRFGDTSFCNFDWGDSEIRYTWNNITIGFGTEAIWLGPAQINPIMHSNNASSYPKIDIGIRRTSIEFFGIWFGDIEGRYWLGKLSESEYFDNNDENNDNLIAGLALGYEVPFLPGLTVGFNRTMLSHWKDFSPYTTLDIIVPGMKSKAGYDESDQRASVTADYFIPKGGIDLYIEWGKNDYNTGIDNIIRYPFHTQAFTAGFKKINDYNTKIRGQFLFELTYIETSMDYHFFYDWGGVGNSFYTHHLIKQGYTNNGQYLGAGIGSGGNSQYLSYRLYYPKGNSTLFVQRVNPDLNYFYFQAPRNPDSKQPNEDVKSSIRVIVTFGVNSTYFIRSNIRIDGGIVFIDDHNPLNKNDTGTKVSEHRYGCAASLGLKYLF